MKKVILLVLLVGALVGCGKSESMKKYEELKERGGLNALSVSLLLATGEDLKDKEREEILKDIELEKIKESDLEDLENIEGKYLKDRDIKKAIKERKVAIKEEKWESLKWKEGRFVDNFGNENGDEYKSLKVEGVSERSYGGKGKASGEVVVVEDKSSVNIKTLGWTGEVKFTGSKYNKGKGTITSASNGKIITEVVEDITNSWSPVVEGENGRKLIELMKKNDYVDIQVTFEAGKDVSNYYYKVNTERFK